MNARYYAGIGSRETPRIQLAAMREIARHLAVFHGMRQGGTGQALRIAQARGILVYDLGSDETLFRLGADLGIVL